MVDHQLGEAWLENCATPEQLRFFREEGYLIVPDALPPDVLERTIAAADEVALAESTHTRNPDPLKPELDILTSTFRTVSRHDAFLDLLDVPKTFPLLWDVSRARPLVLAWWGGALSYATSSPPGTALILRLAAQMLGWNIQLYISHLIVYPPEPVDAPRKQVGAGWHIDGGRPVWEMEERPQPRLSLKIGYFLTDTTIPECGAMRIVPRSHLEGAPPAARAAGVDPEGAMELKVKAGTAVFFDRRLHHSRGYNYSDRTRKVIFMGFSYRWMRGLD